MYCPHCGHLNADGALYCTNCGTRLTGANPANPAASNPEATASFPRVGSAPSPTQSAETPTAPVERARRVVRSKRPHRNHAATFEAGEREPKKAADEITHQIAPEETSRVSSDEATRVVPQAAERTRVVTTPTETKPTAATPIASTPVVPVESPQQRSPNATDAAPKRHSYGPIVGVAAAVVAVALIGAAVLFGSPSTSGDAPQQAPATTTSTQGSTSSTDTSNSSTQGSSTNANDSSDKADASSDATTSKNENASSNTADAKGSDSQKSKDNEADSGEKSSDIIDNGNGTVSSKTYGYTISMPSQFSQQYGDETGATYYDPTNDITIAIWGDTNPSGTTMESAYNTAKSSAANGDYVAHGKNWVVYSTDNADTGVVYDMTYYENGKSCHMHISYPMSSKSVGDSVIEKVQPTFKLNS